MKANALTGAIAIAALGVLAPACSSIEEELRPITESLRTPEMNAAIEEARGREQASRAGGTP